MPNSISDPRGTIRALAFAEGFDSVRFARAQAPPGASARLKTFLGEGRHGTMDWLERNAEAPRRSAALWPEAKSVVVLGANYGPEHDPLLALREKGIGAISVYAQGSDYHDVVKTRLKRVAASIARDHGAEVKVFVDTAPVLEKPLAEAAGMGWQGKHTNLVSREFGSWLFLGSVFTTLELAPDPSDEDHCGSCRACLDACPTNAFPAPYQLDARRCISYLTIEHKDHIPSEFRTAIGNRIYGCDDCLAVCPWNKFASVARESRFHARAELRRPRLADLARLDDASFRELFAGSPIKRVGRDRFVRNVLVAVGNSRDVALAPTAQALLEDASPLVRAMAVWALSRLLEADAFAALATVRAKAEPDGAVRAEWLSPGSG